jgi:radical SAM superfamily enzyme YgiQ (UPF0313 family)
MKVMLATTPIRPIPTNFPPIGSLSIVNYLRKHGVTVDFYHIDGIRPSYADALKHIVDARPDVLGISSVVSTAYAYTKQLALDVKAACPDTLIIVGGSLAASAEILLRRAGVDLCALGEGEKVMLNVVSRARTTRNTADFADIPGLVLLDANGKLVNTGYEKQLDRSEIYNVDWDDLEHVCDMGTYISPGVNNSKADFWFERDARAYEPHRREKMVASLPGAKGCVARCTFCHRWDKGIRYIPPELIGERIKYLIDRYNVGFLHIVDENFGTDVRWLTQFCATIKPFDILWNVAGMRVNCITPEQIEVMKDAGCVAILYGMETGSREILKVMEKKVELEDNYNAMQWTVEAGLHTVVQLVVGMPGETSKTIADTAKFAAFACSIAAHQRPWDLSINYAQALPGTPLYEFARRTKMVDPSQDGEEAYLLTISDRDAADERTTLNFTTSPYWVHQSWRKQIQLTASSAYIRKFGKQRYASMLASDTRYFARTTSEESGYFNSPKKEVERTGLSDSLHGVRTAVERTSDDLPSLYSLMRKRQFGMAVLCYPELFAPFSKLFPLFWFLQSILTRGAGVTFRELMNWLSGGIRQRIPSPSLSLRKFVFNEMPALQTDSPEMDPLRRGR